ncbi:MAG: esterase-like activity of phytase family protein, partial [Verrucomicrobiaceae bacterium]
GLSGFAAWLAAREFSSYGFGADTDHDGLTDGVEYFFNQNPNSASGFGNLPNVASNNGALEFGFTRLTDAGGLEGELLVSGDLTSWVPALSGIDFTSSSELVNGNETTVTYSLKDGQPSAPGVSATYLTPNTSDPVGAMLGGVRVMNEGLVGVGRLSGDSLDKFGETQGAASGLLITDWAYEGGQFSGTFQVLPDRGHGDGTSNYAARLHEVDFTFTPYYGAGPVSQNQVSATYADSTKFIYQDGAVEKFTTGLNPTGNSILFGQAVGVVTAANGPGGAPESLLSFDAEAIHLFEDGSGFVSDEYGTYIARFDSAKKITGMTQLPGAAQPFRPAGTPNFDSVSAPTTGRRNNQGLEGMTVTPDGTRLFALLQSATVQDTNGASQQTRNHARLFVYDIAGANRENPVLVEEYVVRLPQIDLNGNGSGLDGTAAQSEIVALGNSSFLMLPRDGNGMGKGTTLPIVFKSVQLVDFASATNIVGQYDGVG